MQSAEFYGPDWIGKANSCMLRKSKHVLMILQLRTCKSVVLHFLDIMMIGLGTLFIVHGCTAGFYSYFYDSLATYLAFLSWFTCKEGQNFFFIVMFDDTNDYYCM